MVLERWTSPKLSRRTCSPRTALTRLSVLHSQPAVVRVSLKTRTHNVRAVAGAVRRGGQAAPVVSHRRGGFVHAANFVHGAAAACEEHRWHPGGRAKRRVRAVDTHHRVAGVQASPHGKRAHGRECQSEACREGNQGSQGSEGGAGSEHCRSQHISVKTFSHFFPPPFLPAFFASASSRSRSSSSERRRSRSA